MKLHRTILVLILCALCCMPVKAAKWTTHFAYNNVTQIAMTPDQVFAVSDGSLFSVDKMTEQIRVYNSQSGLHGTGITCIHYDEAGKQLIIGYANGKIDLLSARGTKYIGELYDKDMTQRKNIYNITIQGRTAYLSTHYGVQTMDLRENKLVDSYWLRPNGQETAVLDVLIANDSIYAFTSDSLFCAAMSDNLVDYTFWRREARSGRITPDANKGTHYQDATDNWKAGHAAGIIRLTPTDSINYKPQGPLSNTPYYLHASGSTIYMLSGGRWSEQYFTPGHVMYYSDKQWTCILADSIKNHTQNPVFDFMNAAVDPRDHNHFFVTSYGTGLYEFQDTQCIAHYLAADSNTLGSADPSVPNLYTRLDYAVYDRDSNLWMLNAGAVAYPLVCLDATGSWHGLPLIVNHEPQALHTPGGLILDHKNAHYKWFSTARYNQMLGLLDDNGTPFDASDDRIVKRSAWITQTGLSIQPEEIRVILQDVDGRIWMGTEQGIIVIDTIDYFTSDRCLRPVLMDNNGENPLESQRVMALCEDPSGKIWVGTEGMGVYVLEKTSSPEPAEQWQLAAHYTTDNSVMPTNGIMALTYDENGKVFIGTAEGLVEYDPNEIDEGLNGYKEETDDLDEGVMQRWRLHLSYNNAQQIASAPKQIFAVADGSLFSIDRKDEEIVYWSKATGLNGTSVSHIAYDAASGKLIIAYENGQIDLLDNDGNVTQMPDISMKAGSIDVTINSICVGSRHSYLAMPFGIIAIQPRKGEVSDTYYIGTNAASIEVQHIAEAGDSLYAFSFDRMYKAALKDNLIDYSLWQSEALPFEQVQQAMTYNNRLYVLANNMLYKRNGATWQSVVSTPLEWFHVNDNQLLAYQSGTGLIRLKDDEQWEGLSNRYVAADAVYSNGEYWLAEVNYGLVRLSNNGDAIYHTDGPNSNFGYYLYSAHQQMYSAIGGRWANQFQRYGRINIYDGTAWHGISTGDIGSHVGKPAIDIVSLAIDPNDAGHFFAATYGTGVFEFRDYIACKHYTQDNSSLRVVNDNHDPQYYTRTDGAMIDEKGNLWVLNATEIGKPLHVMTPSGQWVGLRLASGGKDILFTTPTGIWTDRRKSQWKWMMDQRVEPRLILLDDGGTPTTSSDDRCMARSTFVDQNGNTITPANFRCFAQDHTNRIWIGTEKGLITIPKEVDFFTSNTCRRIIIPRNDGTGLGDYLLGDEQINCLAVDGGDRLWIGTANSGLYLIEDDTITVAHFTESNSLLPSNSVVSIAIMPHTGEVFVGTDKGIASYRSDASEATETMSGAYAYPNPVRPDYGGMISITGLMDNTVVNIIDAGGNLVCKTRSHGGTAVWDGKLPDGRRATPGVYTALCNANGGHTVVKILVIR